MKRFLDMLYHQRSRVQNLLKFMVLSVPLRLSSPQVIDVYGEHLNRMDESGAQGKGRCITLRCRLAAKLNQANPPTMPSLAPYLRGLDRVPINDIKRILLPIGDGVHWVLLMVDMECNAFVKFDSLGLEGTQPVESAVKFLKIYLTNRGKNPAEWPIMIATNQPLQSNQFDCGVFVMKYMECLLNDCDFSFTADDIPLIRRTLCNQFLAGVYGKSIYLI
ncbi:uncharacterized protein LOC143855157 isoform X2 [Tasmannia lanceolata]|uniref:uncharacterized protein LOC143855157 isoform X2 n=1 Tax=Tasmannia lanceolata TaxID=3420 RepID=UPI004063C321